MIRRKRRKDEAEVNMSVRASIHNRFDIEVRDAKTGELKQRARAFNVVCDALWERVFGFRTYFSYIVYGSGSGTPTTTDTALFSRIDGRAVSSESSESLDKASGIFSLRKSMTIDETTSVGQTITEVGIGYDNTSIVTHAMLEDMNGNPISILKTDTDIITFYATIYVHWNASGYQDGNIRLGFDNRGSGGALRYAYAGSFLGWVCGLYVPGSYQAGNARFIASHGEGTYRPPQFETNRPQSSVMGWINCNSAARTISLSLRFPVGCANFPVTEFLVALAPGQYDVYPFLGIDARAVGPLSRYAVAGESLGTGDGVNADYDFKFPYSGGVKIYIDGTQIQSGFSLKNPVVSYRWPCTGQTRDSYSNIYHFDFCPLTHSGYTTRNFTYNFENQNGDSFSYIDFGEGAGSYVTATLYVSDDGINYTQIWSVYPYNGGTHYLGDTYNNRYVRLEVYTGDNATISMEHIHFSSGGHTVTFDTPPAAGAVITADYIPDCIPKDSDHVFDFGVTITLGDYTGG